MATSDEDGKTTRFDSVAQKMGEGVAGQDVTAARKKKPDPPSLRENVKLCKASPSFSQEAWRGWTVVMLVCRYVETEAREGKEPSRTLCRELQSQGGEQEAEARRREPRGSHHGWNLMGWSRGGPETRGPSPLGSDSCLDTPGQQCLPPEEQGGGIRKYNMTPGAC